MLRIHLVNTRDNILREDLTQIVSDAEQIRPYHSELFRLCQEKSGVGIAANQVGLRENFFFVTAGAKFPTTKGNTNYAAHMCINPRWIPDPKSSKIIDHEGCLSLPGRDFLVERESAILAWWTSATGHEVLKKKLTGWAARVFQHEHDHLRGITLLETGKEVQ